MTDSALPSVIDAAFERRAEFSPTSAPAEIRDAVEQAITLLDSGKGQHYVVTRMEELLADLRARAGELLRTFGR